MFKRLTIVGSLIGVLALSGCIQGGEIEDVVPTQSPYEDEKVIFTGAIENRIQKKNQGESLTSSSIIPAGETFEFIVNDICVEERLGAKSSIQYMIDKFVDKKSLSRENDLIRESVIAIELIRDITIGDLQRYARVDDCVVGITDQVSLDIQPTVFNDPQYSIQDYMTQLGFDKADLFMKEKIDEDIRVRVAVIDSGYDFNSHEINRISPDLEGSDIFNSDDNPQDTLGHGTEVSNLINAKANNGRAIVGAGYRHVELLPIRLFGNSNKRKISSRLIFETIKRAGNMGAEGISLCL